MINSINANDHVRYPEQSEKDAIYVLAIDFLINAGPIPKRAEAAVLEVLKEVRSGGDKLPPDLADLEVWNIRAAEVSGFQANRLNEEVPPIPPAYERQFKILKKLLGEDDEESATDCGS